MRILAHAYLLYSTVLVVTTPVVLYCVLCHASVGSLTGVAISGVMGLRTTLSGANITVQTLSTSGQEVSVGQHQFGVRHQLGVTPHPQSSNLRPVA